MELRNVLKMALLGTVLGAILGVLAALLVTGNNYRVMFLLTFSEVGLIVGLLYGAKIEDKKERPN
ncbi:MAG: hypothetical protein ACYCSO_05945 [Cuniculiplasma sp.]